MVAKLRLVREADMRCMTVKGWLEIEKEVGMAVQDSLQED